ncbi:MAG: NUDIX domain-containing protein [Nanoarchaeota archaeon]
MADELVDVVDEKNNVIGQDLRSKKLENGYISRNISVFVRDTLGNYFTFKRAPHKKAAPNQYDSLCGHLVAGEDYPACARREILEEVGVVGELRLLDIIYQEVPDHNGVWRFHTGIFVVTTDEPFKLNDEHTGFEKHTLSDLACDLRANPEKYTSGLRNEYRVVGGMLEKFEKGWMS